MASSAEAKMLASTGSPTMSTPSKGAPKTPPRLSRIEIVYRIDEQLGKGTMASPPVSQQPSESPLDI
jgi:hypothetical protein